MNEMPLLLDMEHYRFEEVRWRVQKGQMYVCARIVPVVRIWLRSK